MLSSAQSQLARALQLDHISDEEELGRSISALLTTARESSPQIPLSRVAHEIVRADVASLLDPLDTLPILLPCKDPAAREILALIGECGSAKEIVIAAQEAIERLTATYETFDDDDNKSDATQLSFPTQIEILVDLYSACIPRLKLRRKTTSETLSPLLRDLEQAIRLSGPLASSEEGRSLISSASRLVIRSRSWAKSFDSQTDESRECDKLLESLLDCTLLACEHCIKASLAQRSLETIYPRLATRSSVPPGWEAGEEAVSEAINAYLSLGFAGDSLITQPLLSRMVIYAHLASNPLASTHLGKLVSMTVSSIQANCGLDEALTILLRGLAPVNASPRSHLSEDIIFPLFAVIPHLSSSHPDSLVRHQAFRILSVLLASCPPLIRMQLLRELTVDENYPQMRVASVGLVREAILEGLSHPPHLFASPRFFDVFGPILFRPNPPNLLLDEGLSFESLEESSESARLVESLGTYYTILLRDTDNLTHMRNKDALNSVETSLLSPLRLALGRLGKNLGEAEDHNRNAITLGSLQMSVERVDEAISRLRKQHSGVLV